MNEEIVGSIAGMLRKMGLKYGVMIVGLAEEEEDLHSVFVGDPTALKAAVMAALNQIEKERCIPSSQNAGLEGVIALLAGAFDYAMHATQQEGEN